MSEGVSVSVLGDVGEDEEMGGVEAGGIRWRQEICGLIGGG